MPIPTTFLVEPLGDLEEDDRSYVDIEIRRRVREATRISALVHVTPDGVPVLRHYRD